MFCYITQAVLLFRSLLVPRDVLILTQCLLWTFSRVYRGAHSKCDTESSVESGSFRCLPQTIRIISCKQSRNGTILSPVSDVRNSSSQQEYSARSSPLGSSKSASNRMTDPSLGKLSSARIESFHKEDMIKIEESWVASHCSHIFFIYWFLFLNTYRIYLFTTAGFLLELGL